MTDPRYGAGDGGPGEESPGPPPFPPRKAKPRGVRRPLAFPGRTSQASGSRDASAGRAQAPMTGPASSPSSQEPGSSSPSVPEPMRSLSARERAGVAAEPAPLPSARERATSGSESAPGSPPSEAARSTPPVSALSDARDARTSSEPVVSPGPDVAAEPPVEIAAVAAEVFGDRLELAVEYARLLVTDGVVRGLIGPREAPRIWDRHLVNCAVVSQIIPIGASIVDVGSGAGLPGIVLAVARPDLHVTLVEPLARRTAFLSEAVAALGLEQTVTVVRGRAEDVVDGPPGGADIVTARAVAPLDRLAGWCLPLAKVGGRLLALKGVTAADEAAEHRDAIAALGGSDPVLRLCGEGLIDPPTTVIEVVVQSRPKSSTRAAGPARGAGGRTGGRGSGQRRSRRG